MKKTPPPVWWRCNFALVEQFFLPHRMQYNGFFAQLSLLLQLSSRMAGETR